MRVLWIVNMVFPEVAKRIGIPTSTSGTWLIDLARGISECEDIELGIMTYYSGEAFQDIEHNGVRYFLLPGGGKRLLYNNPKTGEDCNRIVELFSPELIHLHGTEYAPGHEMLKVHPEIPALLTIQGIIKRIAEEYYGGLTFGQRLKLCTLKDILKGKTPFTSKLLYMKNAKREADILKRVRYVTGRTDWDKATMLAINPNLIYYRCNYNLSDAFYNSEKWSLDTIQPHTITTGAAHYSLKGLHIAIEALKIVKEKYPDVKLYIPGGGKAEKGRLVKKNNYTRYIEKMIRKYNLDDNVVYLGNMSSLEVANQLKKSHICIVPSAIEGASATLREAMMIGTPSICAYRGGMTDLLTDGITGFTYDFPEYPMLALRIMDIFESDELAQRFSERTIKLAEDRHNRERNPMDMVSVYKEILKNGQ